MLEYLANLKDCVGCLLRLLAGTRELPGQLQGPRESKLTDVTFGFARSPLVPPFGLLNCRAVQSIKVVIDLR
jgi:hypothetical protein